MVTIVATNTCNGSFTLTLRAHQGSCQGTNAIIVTVQNTNAPSLVLPPNTNITCNLSTDPTVTGYATATDNCTSTVLKLEESVWINEFHYENSSGDANEFVEVAGVAGTDLSAWALVLYGGFDGRPYVTIPLSGIIPDEGCGYGARAFFHAPIQNGPDGIALVHVPSQKVAQFISYEGAPFTAVGGPAAGMASTVIPVNENGSSFANKSLQLTGAGNKYASFVWSGPANNSPGTLNPGQTISPCNGAVVISYSDFVAAGACANTTTITRNWTANNNCGNTATLAQTITVQDTVPPVLTVPADVTVQCDQPTDPAHTGQATAADNCSPSALAKIWINEFHYDNIGPDANEFVEIAGEAGTDLLSI